MSVQTLFPTSRAIGYSGQPEGNSPRDVETMRNDEATAEMAFGIAVKQASATDQQSAELFTAITAEPLAGIIMRSHSFDQSQLGDDGVKPGALIDVVRKGRLLVTCEDGCSVGDPLHIRAVAAGAELAGALLAAADGTDTIDVSGYATWRSSAAAGELAVLEFDFSGFPIPA